MLEVDRAKAQMKALMAKLQKAAPCFVEIMRSMEEDISPAVSNALKSVEAIWKAALTTPIDKEQWAAIRPSKGQDDFKSYDENIDYAHLKKVFPILNAADSMASLDVTMAVAAFASDLSRLKRTVSSLELSVAPLESTGSQQIHMDAFISSWILR